MKAFFKSLCFGGALAIAALFMGANETQAQDYHSRGYQPSYPGVNQGYQGYQGYQQGYYPGATQGYGYGGSRSGAVYDPPSVHYDRVYHADRLHWTPGRGLHTHGHYDLVPHYTPGHYDRLHGNHIDLNPRYHR